jgi:hypothetical protein
MIRTPTWSFTPTMAIYVAGHDTGARFGHFDYANPLFTVAGGVSINGRVFATTRVNVVPDSPWFLEEYLAGKCKNLGRLKSKQPICTPNDVARALIATVVARILPKACAGAPWLGLINPADPDCRLMPLPPGEAP